MYRLNRRVEYALMALRHMSQKKPGELTPAKEISETLRAPFDAIARVLQVMANKGLLRSEQGVSGGYQIIKDLAKVSIHELVEMIEGPHTLVPCIHTKSPCDLQDTCNISTPLTALNQRTHEFYRGIKVGELLEVSHV